MSEKKKFEIENLIKTSSSVLYNMIATADGLSEWFANKVSVDKENIYTFSWEGDEEEARMIAKNQGESIRFQWLDDEEDDLDTFFELRIAKVPSDPKLTSLFIVDFAEEDEIEEARFYWDKQLTILKRKLGS